MSLRESTGGGVLGILMQGNMSKLIHIRCIPCCQIVVLREFVPTVDAPVRIRLSACQRQGLECRSFWPFKFSSMSGMLSMGHVAIDLKLTCLLWKVHGILNPRWDADSQSVSRVGLPNVIFRMPENQLDKKLPESYKQPWTLPQDKKPPFTQSG